MPDKRELMQKLLLTLDGLGIDGINLLELCFPLHNAEEFKRRGYAIKNEQMRVLYNYWYAGGLPIAGSERVCLQLLAFALEQNLNMGVHYCSLENKFTGQVYRQNFSAREDYPYCSFSERDYFLKSVKAYGSHAQQLAKLLTEREHEGIRYDKQAEVVEFLPSSMELLAAEYPDLEMALSYHVVEQDDKGQMLRELRLDLTTPASFDLACDL
ncbi:MAG: hypothetical protein LBJ48_00600, partial [Coriobacteriales bacterium]|jgi:pyruvate formate-lyase activating enzyme-like uncharacterized protein|nr:hypothetical protein [Coriobacteriales bacterium]